MALNMLLRKTWGVLFCFWELMLFIISLVYNLKSLVCLVADVLMQEKKYKAVETELQGVWTWYIRSINMAQLNTVKDDIINYVSANWDMLDLDTFRTSHCLLLKTWKAKKDWWCFHRQEGYSKVIARILCTQWLNNLS